MSTDHEDASRVEAAEAGVHLEQGEVADRGRTEEHVTATDAVGAGHPGHGADPNAGVVRADPPSGRELAAAAVVAIVTLLALIALGVAIARA